MSRGGIEMEPDVVMTADIDTLSDAELIEAKCNICSQDMFGSNPCYHWPGQTYLDEDGNKVMCQALIYHQPVMGALMIDQQKCMDAIDALKSIQPYLNDAKNQKRVHKLLKYLKMELRRTQAAKGIHTSLKDLTMG